MRKIVDYIDISEEDMNKISLLDETSKQDLIKFIETFQIKAK